MTTEQMAEWLEQFLEDTDAGMGIASQDLVVLDAIAGRLHELGAAALPPTAAAPEPTVITFNISPTGAGPEVARQVADLLAHRIGRSAG